MKEDWRLRQDIWEHITENIEFLIRQSINRVLEAWWPVEELTLTVSYAIKDSPDVR